jgi:hypothetical protein
MRKNLLKNMLLALFLTVAVLTMNAQIAHVGDILCEGALIVSPANYNANTHTAIGVVFYVDNTGQHGWAVALQDAGSFVWGCDGVDTPLSNYGNKRQAIYDLDGYENTLIVRQHSTDHPAFYAVDFENGWYVPAIGQLNYLYGNLIEINASLTIVGGYTLFSENWEYWSSTEHDDYAAWYLQKSGELKNRPYGYASIIDKGGSRIVRSVKSF